MFCSRARALAILSKLYVTYLLSSFGNELREPKNPLFLLQSKFDILSKNVNVQNFLGKHGLDYIMCFLVGKLNFECSYYFFEAMLDSKDLMQTLNVGLKHLIIIHLAFIENNQGLNNLSQVPWQILQQTQKAQLEKVLLFEIGAPTQLQPHSSRDFGEKQERLERDISNLQQEVKKKDLKLTRAYERIMLVSLECERLCKVKARQEEAGYNRAQ